MYIDKIIDVSFAVQFELCKNTCKTRLSVWRKFWHVIWPFSWPATRALTYNYPEAVTYSLKLFFCNLDFQRGTHIFGGCAGCTGSCRIVALELGEGMLDMKTLHSLTYVISIYLYLSILTGWWFQPVWQIWKSIGMMTFPIYGKIKAMFQNTNQLMYVGWTWPQSPCLCLQVFQVAQHDLSIEQSQFLLALDAQLRKYPAIGDLKTLNTWVILAARRPTQPGKHLYNSGKSPCFMGKKLSNFQLSHFQ